MAVPDSLPQRIFLLAYRPDKGRVAKGADVGMMLRAAALADLYLGGHLIDERGRAIIHIRQPRHDPVLDAILEEIAGSKPGRWKRWIERRQGATFRAVRQQLGDSGWVHLQPHRFLGLFPTTRVTIRDPLVREELRRRVTTALNEPIDTVDRADATVVAIIAVGGLTSVLDRRTRRANKQRIRQLTEHSGPIVPALRAAINDAASGLT